MENWTKSLFSLWVFSSEVKMLVSHTGVPEISDLGLTCSFGHDSSFLSTYSMATTVMDSELVPGLALWHRVKDTHTYITTNP